METTQTVQAMYQAFGSGDMETFFSYLVEGAVWESRYVPGVPFHGTFSGRAEILQLFGMLETLVEMHSFVPTKMLADDETVVSFGYEELTVKETGIRYRNNWIHVFTFDGDKVSKVQTSSDVAAALAAFHP